MEVRVSFRDKREPQKLGRPGYQEQDKRGGDQKLNQAESFLFHPTHPRLMAFARDVPRKRRAVSRGGLSALPSTSQPLFKKEEFEPLFKSTRVYSGSAKFRLAYRNILKITPIISITKFRPGMRFDSSFAS
jgi:hypothetical protein